MGFLKFTDTECEVVSEFGARDAVVVTIGLSAESWRTFAARLGEIANREGSELRTDFPGGWTIFWKIRDGDSRFFVAHPETDQWVATLALSESHLGAIREKLANGFAGPLSELEPVNRMSNVEVKVRVRAEGA